MNIYVINGPNINLLGTREPEIYGRETLEGIAIDCKEKASKDGHIVKFMQSNYEGEIVEWIQEAIMQKVDAIVINAAAYTHTSIAIHDALKSYSGYKVELHSLFVMFLLFLPQLILLLLVLDQTATFKSSTCCLSYQST